MICTGALLRWSREGHFLSPFCRFGDIEHARSSQLVRASPVVCNESWICVCNCLNKLFTFVNCSRVFRTPCAFTLVSLLSPLHKASSYGTGLVPSFLCDFDVYQVYSDKQIQVWSRWWCRDQNAQRPNHTHLLPIFLLLLIWLPNWTEWGMDL